MSKNFEKFFLPSYPSNEKTQSLSIMNQENNFDLWQLCAAVLMILTAFVITSIINAL